MNKNHQPTLNGIRLWSELQTVPFQELAATINDANAAGFEPVRMATDRKRGEYVVSFQRMTEAQAHRIAAIVGNARLVESKPADDAEPADEANDATGGSVDTAWLAVVAKALPKKVREPLFDKIKSNGLGQFVQQICDPKTDYHSIL